MHKHLALIIAIGVCLAAPQPAQSITIELTDRMVRISGGINSKSISKAVKEILKLDGESHDPIWLMMDSYGGSVGAGYILIDVMKAIKSPVYAVVTSKAYSMGAIITIHCEKRYIYPHATMMLHEASYGALGEDPSIRSRIEFNTKYLDRLHIELAKIMKMNFKKYRARIRDAWWVLAPEAVKARMVDAVVTKVTFKKLTKTTLEIKRTSIFKKRRVVRPNGDNGKLIKKHTFK
jgi:ATP-dependent Clp protease protease subunit